MINNDLILVLSLHPVFGWKFIVHSAELTEGGNIRIIGAALVEEGLPDEIVSIIKLTEGISDQRLMKDYSRSKTFAEFKKELTKDTLNLYIRPRIEGVNRKIVEVARQHEFDVYLRENLSEQFLYGNLNIKVVKASTECIFNFVKDEKCFRYFISFTNDGREISLQTKRAVIISENPSVVLIEQEIHCVENIESKKLVPFFTKEYIEVPPQSEEIYLKNFVMKTMQKYEVKLQGIPFREIKPERKAVLLLDKSIDNELVLMLWCEYDGQERFAPGRGKRKNFRLEKSNDEVNICWYNRDEEWEAGLIDKLLKEGLVSKINNQYCYGRPDDSTGLLNWLKDNEFMLQRDFVLEQQSGKEYYIGGISMQTSMDDKIDWFDVSIVVMVGEYKISFNHFRKHILNGNRDFILPNGKIMIIPDEWFEKYSDLFRLYKDSGASLKVKKYHTSLLQHALNGQLPQKDAKTFGDVLNLPAERPAIPPEIKAELRPYQKEGFYWMAHLCKNNFGACLADDMGLGKTLQTITLMQHLYSQSEQKQVVSVDGQRSLFDDYSSVLSSSLVVAPTSLLHNWKNEFRRFAPGLKVLVYAGNERLKIRDLKRKFDYYQVVISSYGTVRNDIESLCNYPFKVIVLDESQYIKNPESMVYRAIKQLNSSYKIVLTGTPVENSLEDLWAQFNFINEGLLGSFSFFRKEFISKILKSKNEGKEDVLKRLINPFILRRTKEKVTPELPPLTQEIIYCSMTEKHQEAYETEKNRMRNLLLDAKENPALKTNKFVVLEGLNKLRQIANHPRLTMPDYTEDSGKFEQIIMSFESIRASHHKVLIFSSFVKHLNLLAEKFNNEGWKYSMLTGETIKREEEVTRFREDDDISCFLISLKAGSTGLNLTEADYVFIIDPWWNPASELQALSRAHRIGQDKPVIVYRFITSETVEEKILQLQEVKKELFETFVSDANPLAQLNWGDIEQLL